jgi:hypothetical protein
LRIYRTTKAWESAATTSATSTTETRTTVKVKNATSRLYFMPKNAWRLIRRQTS